MRQLLLDLTRAPRPTFANFVPGGNTELLHRLVAASRGDFAAPVIYIWGEKAAGKTHLAEAFREAVAGEPGFAVIDDAEKLDEAAQVALFNEFNERAFRLLVVTAGSAPRDVPLRRDLATRLATGLTYRVLPLTDAEKRAALAAHARARGFDLSEEVSAYLLTHARRDMGSLMSALDALDRYSLETGRPITVPLLKTAMGTVPFSEGKRGLSPKRKLALFDLDNTLLDGDSDVAWAQFLIEEGVLHPEEYHAKNNWFAERYKDGTLDIHEFLDFQLAPIANRPREVLDRWHERFMQRKIRPIIHARAAELLARHAGAVTALVTATNRFITAPIAAELGIEHLVATDIEECDGLFTGKPRGTPCFREGKIERVREWLASRGERLEDYESWFYSDSLNDLPLLRLVDHPVAVDPDATLRAHAEERGWPIVSLRDETRSRMAAGDPTQMAADPG